MDFDMDEYIGHYRLALAALGMQNEVSEDDIQLAVDNLLMETWGISFEAWVDLTDTLVRMTKPFTFEKVPVWAFGAHSPTDSMKWDVLVSYVPGPRREPITQVPY